MEDLTIAEQLKTLLEEKQNLQTRIDAAKKEAANRINEDSRMAEYPPALSHSWERGRLWRICPRHAPGNGTVGAARKGQAAAERRYDAPLTDSARPCHVKGGDGG